MSGMDLVTVRFGQIPGLSYVQGLGTQILAFALLAWLGLELYRFLTRGTCDFATPIVHVGLAVAIVHGIPSLGGALGGAAQGIGKAILDVSETQLFGEAFNHAVGQVYNQSALSALSSMLTFKGLLVLFGCVLYLGMMVLKLLVIDVLWPICFNLTLVVGLIAVPLGALPGGQVMGWLRTLLEVSLWPVIFQLLVALMVGSFKGLLEQVVALDAAGVFTQGVSLGGTDPGAVEALSRGVLVLVRFWALCLGYCLLGIGTPMLASVAVRSGPMSAALGAAASLGRSVVSMAKASLGQLAGALGLVGRAAGSIVAPAAGRALASPMKMGEVLGVVAENLHRSAEMLRTASRMDQRQYRESSSRGGQG